MPATRRAVIAAAAANAAVVALAALTTTGCTSTPDPGGPRLAGAAPFRLSVGSVDVQEQPQTLPANFIDRRRTDDMLAATREYLRQRFQAAGGAESGKAVIEQASLVEARDPPSGITGVITGGRLQLVGSLAVRVAVADGFGIEKSFARAKVEMRRPVPEGSSVVERDRLARETMNDLIEAVDRSLQSTVRENLGPYLASS
jgi:hypothetical protein